MNLRFWKKQPKLPVKTETFTLTQCFDAIIQVEAFAGGVQSILCKGPNAEVTLKLFKEVREELKRK